MVKIKIKIYPRKFVLLKIFIGNYYVTEPNDYTNQLRMNHKTFEE